MRRYDLDWLRVIVFGLLIFYHVGMFFVPWGFHIKNNIIYDWLRYPMLFLNQWRLPVLFIISGMGTYYALSKRTGQKFAMERIKRLLLPLVVGILFIVPPQVYIERIVNEQFSGSYFNYWPLHAFTGIYPEGNFSWHHLWFLPYLLLFSLVLIPAFLYVRKHPENKFLMWLKSKISNPFWLFIFIVPLFFIEAFLEPYFPITHALVGDWFAVVNYMALFFYGFILISVKEAFWKTVENSRKFYLICGITGFTTLIFFEDSTVIHFTEAFIKVFNLWAWILVLFGYASAYLNRQSNTLSYCNEAVYPFYILHQTIMIILAYYLMDLKWGFLLKSSILIVGTFGISWISYEFFIRRWKWIRPLFGLKNKD